VVSKKDKKSKKKGSKPEEDIVKKIIGLSSKA
jgi:hypothetical protein